MTPDALTDPRESEARPSGTVALFLSLYLVLFAFFILLVANSDGVSRKGRAILDGLNGQFASDAARSETRFVSDLGDVIGPSEFLDRVRGVYETAIPAAHVAVVTPGRQMQLSFHVDSLFEHDTETLRPAQRRAIAGLVASLSSPPPGLVYVAEAVFGVAAPEGLLPVASERQGRRAAIVAAAFADQGAPEGSVRAALEPGDPTEVRLIFRVEGEAK